MCQFAEYCRALEVQPGQVFDRAYRKMFDPPDEQSETVLIDLDKLSRSEQENLARWAKLRLKQLSPSDRGMLPIPRRAQDTLMTLCGFDRRRILEILSAA